MSFNTLELIEIADSHFTQLFCAGCRWGPIGSFRHCANITEHTYMNLDGTACDTSRLDGWCTAIACEAQPGPKYCHVALTVN